MARVGRTTSKFYAETRGLKASGGQEVKAGSILTRQGHRWKPGINVNGSMHLTAKCDGEVYFTRKKGQYNKIVTYINVRSEKK
jgi:ribosomal protein L27